MVRAGALAGWLHRVAVRAAIRLRRIQARRSAEPLPPELHAPEPTGDELVWREVRQTFDTEVGRLPDRLRLPLVLCCLQGKTRSEAAAELGWSEGAVRGRLERGAQAPPLAVHPQGTGPPDDAAAAPGRTGRPGHGARR